jgi:hypothetical protein
MKQKWWFLPATVLAVFGLLMMGCPSGGGGDDDDDDDATTAYSYEFKGDGSEYTLWGNKKPVIEDGWLKVDDGSSQSTGFVIKFADIGYTQKASDTLIFTYSVEIETPEACLLTKIPKGDNMNEPIAGANYDTGGGLQHFLGSALKDKNDVSVSNYDLPTAKATWDAATKTGTFQVLMKHLGLTTGVGFQTNPWAEMGGSKVSEDAKFKVKFLKVENAVGEAFVCDCGHDITKCDCGEDCDCEEPCELPPDPAFAAGTGTKLIVKVGASNVDATGVATMGNNASDIPALKYFDDNTGYLTGSAGYGNAFTKFKVALGGTTYTKVKVTFQGVDGDVGDKAIAVYANATDPTSGYYDFQATKDSIVGVSGNAGNKDAVVAAPKDLEITITGITGDQWIIFNIHAGNSAFKISKIEFTN